MFGFGKKKVEEKKPVAEKQEKDEKSIRIDVEDLTDQGYTCEEIVQELGVDKDRVYRIREARKRRSERVRAPEGSSSQAEEDPLKALNVKIKEAELQSKLDSQKWDNKIKEIEMQQKLQELQYDNSEEENYQAQYETEITPEQNFLAALMPALPMIIKNFMGGSQQATASPIVIVPEKKADTSQVPFTSFSPAAGGETNSVASEPAAEGLLSEEEVNANAARVKSMIPKKYQLMLPLARSEINKFSDKDKIRMLNKILE